MKTIVVQIPCYNEAATLPVVLATIPRRVGRAARVRTLVVDDGSTDGTAAVARRAGADYVVRHTRNRGLAAAFQTGLTAALRLGADVIVNTDGDNQYPQADLPRLVAPILAGTADVVVADRQTARVAHFSPLKKLLQTVGSALVRVASGTGVRDAPSGFRAYSREAALRLYVHSRYSYTLETLIQAGAQRLRVASVPVVVNPQVRASRLMSSLPSYLLHSGTTLLRAYVTYRPLVVFSLVGALFLAIGTAGILRFLYYFVTDGGAGHIQSVVLAGTLWSVGVMIVLSGLQADLAAANRRLAEEALYELRRRDDTERQGRKAAARVRSTSRPRARVRPPTGGLKQDEPGPLSSPRWTAAAANGRGSPGESPAGDAASDLSPRDVDSVGEPRTRAGGAQP
jgi:glycosyltransferase involved in cell wall biosynthesis